VKAWAGVEGAALTTINSQKSAAGGFTKMTAIKATFGY
jgi:hypothetical protein